MKTMVRIYSYWFVLAGLGLLLSGCMQTATIGSVAGGECKIFERPRYVVLGKRPYDQDWIDSQVEGGIGGCKWKRPAPRPPELDVVPGRKTVAPVPVKSKGFLKRIRDRVLPPKVEAPIGVPPPAPVVVAPEPVAPPPAPRRPIDELLRPRG